MVGGVAGLVIIGIATLYIVRRSRKNQDEDNPPQFQHQGAPTVYQEKPPTPHADDPSVKGGPPFVQGAPFRVYLSLPFVSFGCGGEGELNVGVFLEPERSVDTLVAYAVSISMTRNGIICNIAIP